MRRMFSKKQIEEISLEKIEATENLKVFENIVDKDGHKRFIEGDITLKTITGVSKIYGKWALSGSHLLIVLCIAIENATDVSNKNLCDIDMPNWIKDKIVALGSTVVSRESFYAFGSDNTTQQITIYLEKISSTIKINTSTFTSNAERTCRISYDLLIDNE